MGGRSRADTKKSSREALVKRNNKLKEGKGTWKTKEDQSLKGGREKGGRTCRMGTPEYIDLMR